MIDRDKTSVTLTPLAQRIVYPVGEADRLSAIRETAGRVPLLKQLYESLGPDFHELDFPAKLLEITHASHEEIEAKGPRVEKVYRDTIQYFRGQPTLAPGPLFGQPSSREGSGE